jgi:glutamyl-tRNA synthetase
MEKRKLTRYAPTPSGFLHLGNIYSFILTYHLAKQRGAKILLRIDDLDQDRIKPAYIQDIFDCLDFMELPCDLGPKTPKEYEAEFSQRHRMAMYETALQVLKEKGRLFACECSRSKVDRMHPLGYYTGLCRDKKLPFEAKDVSWRFRADMHQEVFFQELAKAQISGKLPGILADFIVRRKDGLPAYQLTSVVDDIYFGVDMVVRGKDLWGSTIAQVLLSKSLDKNDFSNALFHHHALLKGPGDKKLSKSAGATSIYHLRKEGKKKEDIFSLIGKMIGLEHLTKLVDFAELVPDNGPSVKSQNDKRRGK